MRRMLMLAALVMVWNFTAFAQLHRNPADILQDSPYAPDVDAKTNGFATLMDADEGLAAYYLTGWNGEQLPRSIWISRLNKRTGQWQRGLLPTLQVQVLYTMTDCRGPINRFDKNAGHYYLGLDLTPSAGCILVLNQDLSVDNVLAGVIETFLPSGSLLYLGDMVHFADVHPETLWAYDPRKGVSTQLYPQSDDPFRAAFSARLAKAMNEQQCNTNNWGCDPSRFTSAIDLPIAVNDETGSFAFHVHLDPEGFVTYEEAQDSGHWDDDEYVYVYQLSPLRWREFSLYDLKPKFGTDSLKDLLTPERLAKVFAVPAPK